MRRMHYQGLAISLLAVVALLGCGPAPVPKVKPVAPAPTSAATAVPDSKPAVVRWSGAITAGLEIIDVVASYLSATTSRQEEQTAPTA